MLEIFELVLKDVQVYTLNIFAPCILALVLIVLHKKNKLKRIGVFLGIIPAIIACKLYFFTSYTYAHMLAIFFIFAILYAASIAIAKRFAENKIVLYLSIPLILICSYLILATYEYIDIREPFGSIEEHSLPESTNSNHDYTIRINYADAWGNGHYTLTFRGNEDTDSQEGSILYCTQYRTCAGVTFIVKDSTSNDTMKVLPTERNRCEWELLPSEKKPIVSELKKLVANYSREYIIGFVLDGYTFDIDIIDYKKRTVRSLKLDNATNFEDQVPKAKEIVNLGLKLIPFNDSVNANIDCNDRLPKLFEQMKVDTTAKDSTLKDNDSSAKMIELNEIKNPKPKRRKSKDK